MHSYDLLNDIAFSAANDNGPEMDEVAEYFDCQFEDFDFEADIDYDEIGQAMIALASTIDKDKTDALRAKSTIDNPSEDYDEDAVAYGTAADTDSPHEVLTGLLEKGMAINHGSPANQDARLAVNLWAEALVNPEVLAGQLRLLLLPRFSSGTEPGRGFVQGWLV